MAIDYTKWSAARLADKHGELRTQKAAIDAEMEKIKAAFIAKAPGDPSESCRFDGTAFYSVLSPPSERTSLNKDMLQKALPGVNLAFFSETTPVDWKLQSYAQPRK